ncbi:MAG TPA: sulfite exporter TauE/SafE family protein [Anaerolineales bacterium]
MTTTIVSSIALFIFAAAILYASVGHAGASGYLAVMALFGVAPEIMRPTALALNVLVATIGTIKFYRAGYFSWSVFWPFALTSIPFSFIGGSLTLPSSVYKVIVGLVLLYAAFRLFWTKKDDLNPLAVKKGPLPVALVFGAGIGLLSGLVGVGGGIFLSPLLILMKWADVKQTSGVSAAFILVNSIAGLSGQIASLTHLPGAIPYWAVAAGIGGWIGAEYGSRRLGSLTLRRLLALVLVVAGVKMILI